MRLVQLLPVSLALLGVSSILAAYDDDNEGVTVGKKMVFHVVDFVNGPSKGRAGCPSVMTSNSGGRGVIIWTRGTDDAAFRLAKALDGKAVDGKKTRGFLVAFDEAGKDLPDRVKGLEHVVAGKSRHTAKEMIDGNKIDGKKTVLVFFLDKKDIKAVRSFEAGELTDARVAEVAREAEKFAAGGK
jgi:hypothetical protein